MAENISAEKKILLPINVDDYVQTRVPDKIALAGNLKDAKGPERTMKQFSQASGISESTLSRIINYKIKEPLSKDVILRIAENASNKSELAGNFKGDDIKEVFLYFLLQANGMVNNKEFEERKKYVPDFDFDKDEKRINRNIDLLNTIALCLLNKGYGIKGIQDIEELAGMEELAFGSTFSHRTMIIDGHEPKYHLFKPESQYLTHLGIIQEIEKEQFYYCEADSILRSDYKFLLNAAWDPQRFGCIKKSYLTDSEELYNAFIKVMSSKKVNTYISIILLDLNKHEVVNEWFVPRSDGKTLKSLFI